MRRRLSAGGGVRKGQKKAPRGNRAGRWCRKACASSDLFESERNRTEAYSKDMDDDALEYGIGVDSSSLVTDIDIYGGLRLLLPNHSAGDCGT